MGMSLRERLYYFRSFWIFPLITLVLLEIAFRAEPGSDPTHLLWLFPAGVLLWTLLEYGLHRFIFHIQIPLRNPRLKEVVNSSHLGHHASPRDPSKVLVHPSYGLVISSILYGLIYAVSGSLLTTTGVIAGVWAGFLYYESVHYRVHFSLSVSGVLQGQRQRHFYHHFTNNKHCFEVTSSLWDHVFGTTFPQQSRI